jgi:hypothetical protein
MVAMLAIISPFVIGCKLMMKIKQYKIPESMDRLIEHEARWHIHLAIDALAFSGSSFSDGDRQKPIYYPNNSFNQI